METLEIQMYTTSKNPEQAIDKIAWTGQPEHLKMYQAGYEHHFEQLPVMNGVDDMKLTVTKTVMSNLSKDLKEQGWATTQNIPELNEFNRTIIALEEPKKSGNSYIPGSQIVIARWGDSHTSPVHGHSFGYMHEEILSGRMRVNTYRITDMQNRIVRPYKTEIQSEGVFVSDFADVKPGFKRQNLVHNFTSIGPSVSMHYLPEYTRDGRDNTFEVEHFSNKHTYWEDKNSVERITSKDGMYLQPGEVLLVRSTNVPEYGDHFVVVTGSPVMKEHGLRIQDVSIIASKEDSHFLNNFEMQTGLILLKLKPEVRDAFLRFHDITVENKVVKFPAL